ncbi:hypothetical protein NIES4073_28310 [Kalymmatonema gypsitolerans NIES-4073]|nr:hypothetical protein NIES4073_28310 [Scytonema sp. NIES-4073]
MDSQKLVYPSTLQVKFLQLQTEIESLLQQMQILNQQLSLCNSKNTAQQAMTKNREIVGDSKSPHTIPLNNS